MVSDKPQPKTLGQLYQRAETTATIEVYWLDGTVSTWKIARTEPVGDSGLMKMWWKDGTVVFVSPSAYQ
jgi:hypothetical protein